MAYSEKRKREVHNIEILQFTFFNALKTYEDAVRRLPRKLQNELLIPDEEFKDNLARGMEILLEDVGMDGRQ